jgi:hypothetical protein
MNTLIASNADNERQCEGRVPTPPCPRLPPERVPT